MDDQNQGIPAGAPATPGQGGQQAPQPGGSTDGGMGQPQPGAGGGSTPGGQGGTVVPPQPSTPTSSEGNGAPGSAPTGGMGQQQ